MVTKPQTSTPMQEWVAQALERMKPILDGRVVVGVTTEDWKQDAMTAMLEDMEWLVQHFKVMPEPCLADHSEIFRAGGVAALNSVVATMKAAPEQRATWDVHPHEEDGA